MGTASYKILIVDDNQEHREMWSLLLAAEGFETETAGDGRAALQLVEATPVDLVMLDVTMPELDGFEVLDRLRASVSADELPVILITGKGKSADIVRGFDLGANDYVTKPANPNVLLARIRSQLRSKTPSPDRVVLVEPSSEPGLRPGEVLATKFRVERLIGRGGSGSVYRAMHLDLGHPVALKLLQGASVASRERLRREGIVSCRLEHPNAVEVLDFCLTEDEVPILVLELLQGDLLARELADRGRLPPARCAEILDPICEVLNEAHGQGVVHRDIKPQNVFLDHSHGAEVIKVLDFGIAKLIEDPEETQTVDCGLVGTPAYLAPERLTDDPYDGRADVYSLGVMLYEMLTGERPFVSRSLAALIRMHLMESPRPLRVLNPALSPELDEIVLAALAKNPADRPTAAGLARDFGAAAVAAAPTADRVTATMVLPAGQLA